MNIQTGQILTAPFWPECVRVISSQSIGSDKFKIEAVGVQTKRFYDPILSRGELEKVEISEGHLIDFSANPVSFFLATEAYRIRYAYQFDPLYAVNVSQVDPLPHQIEAVYHYILQNPRIRFLLADDPGAGKTIMAGLLLKELKYRGLVERTLIIVPGHLKEQWLRELKEKFQETFSIIDRPVMNASWGRNIWQEQHQAITSIDFAKQDDVMFTLADAHWDLVIVDEAHKMAAYRYGDKTDKTERYKFGELISKNTRFLLFLTATPHRGDPENFRLFLDLLEPGFFATTEMLSASIADKDNPLFLRRLKEDLKQFDGTPIFPPRKVETIKYRLSDDEKQLYNAVTQYVEDHYNRALQKDKRNVAFAMVILQRRLASSVRAIRKSLERRKTRLEELHQKGQLIQDVGVSEEERLEDLEEKERWKEEEELLQKLSSADTLEELRGEIEKLDGLILLAKEAEKKQIETKLNKLREVMDTEDLRDSTTKLLIFTEARDTLDYLVEKLKRWGYNVVSIHGGMNLDKRIAAEQEFKHRAQVMVATEAAGEGINLQFCWLMVNYDIPWNPNRLEQRMGRIHRYGQQVEVHIYNLVAVDTREGRILEKLFEKLARMQEHLGSDGVFDVIGDILHGKSLRDLILDAIANKRTLEEILGDFERIPDEEALQKLREAAMESLATRHIDLTRILGEQREARENRLIPEYVERFFVRAADKLHLKVEKRSDGFWRMPSVPFDIRNQPHHFKTRFGEVHREYAKSSFDKEEAFKGQAEFIAPGHPLLEAVIETVFAKWKDEMGKGAVFLHPEGRMDGILWFLEAEIRDGNGQVSGKRLFAVYQHQNDSLQMVSPGVLWDLKPFEEIPDDPIPDGALNPDRVIAFGIDEALNPYKDELLTRRRRDAEIKRKYGVQSLDEQIAQSEEKLIQYEIRRTKGENVPEPTIQNERRNKADLQQKKQALLREIEAETHLLPSTPQMIGVARVIPGVPEDEELKEDRDIEAIGMQVAMDYERRNGRTPEDVSARNLGYDIRSKEGDAYRYIEVKARAKEGRIALTPNEWLMANRLGAEYWLYVVARAATNPELYLIQDPAAKLNVNEKVDIVRYVVSDWKARARRAE